MIGAVFRDSFVYGLSSILSKSLGLILLPLYARVLSPSDFGAFDLITTLGVLVMLTVALEVAQGAGRFFFEVPEQSRRSLMSTAWWFSLGMYGLFAAVATLMAPAISALLFHDANFENVVRLGAVAIALNGMFYFALTQLRWDMQSRIYAVVSFCYAALLLALTWILTVELELGLMGLLLAQCVATTLVTTVAVANFHTKVVWEFDRRALGRMIRFSAPLVPSGLATFAMMYANRIAINEFSSLSEVAVYAVASRIAGAAVVLIVAVQVALTPLVYRHYRESETPREIAQLFSWFCAAAMAACLFLALFAPEIISLLVSSRYERSAPLVGILAPALVLAQMYVFAPGIAIAKRTSVQLLIVSTSAAVGVALNLVLVPNFGGLGASVATLAAAASMALMWFNVSQKYYSIPFQWRKLSFATAALALFSAVGMLSNSYFATGPSLLLRAGLLTVFGLVLLSTLARPTEIRQAFNLIASASRART